MTIVMTEGRRMMRLSRELPSDHFDALLNAYQRLVRGVLEELGGGDVDVAFDSIVAVFATAKEAAVAAAAAQRAVTAHEWPNGLRPTMSVALHSGEAWTGRAGSAALRCSELCVAAEGGEIFMSEATASLLEGVDLGELSLHDLGDQQTRRTQRTVRAYELVVPSAVG
jgi:class 3 adenylate cyclase